jgi:hypothetical protein
VTAVVIWGITTVAVGGWAIKLAIENDGPWNRRAVIVGLIAAASFLRATDHFVYMEKEAGYGSFHGIATLFLLCSLYLVYSLWCDCARLVARKQGLDVESNLTRVKAVSMLVVMFQAPSSLFSSMRQSGAWGLDSEGLVKLDYDVWIQLYMGIGLLCYVVLGTLAAIEMVRISNILKLEGALYAVVNLNLAEQVLFNVLLIACVILYNLPDYDAKGTYQALMYYLSNLIGNWAIHIQVLLFFLACKKTDPFRNQHQFDQLLTTEPLDSDHVEAKKIGSPQNLNDNGTEVAFPGVLSRV